MSNKENLRRKIEALVTSYFELDEAEKSFIPHISHVPVAGRVLFKEDLINLVNSSLDMWLTSGEYTSAFEKSISQFLGNRHTLIVNSGSSANLLAISAVKQYFNCQDGDEVITSAVNFPTTLNPIIQNNLKPVLVDAKLGTYNIDADLIEKSITEKTKGIVLAHTLGNPFDLDKIMKIKEKYGLFLVEDMCDAFGATHGEKFVGNFGEVATLSFYPAHHITTGEGGAVLTNIPKLKKIIESLRDWGRDCYCPPGEDNTCKKRFDWQLGGLPHGYDHKYIYSNIGYNLKATDMQAAIGLSQMEQLPYFIEKRRLNFDYLYEEFSNFEVFDMPIWDTNSQPSWFGFPITINQSAKFERVELLKFYQERNIGTRLLFAGNILLQPAYIEKNLGVVDDYPVANTVSENTFWLGVYPGLNQEMLEFVVAQTKEFLNNN
jgi:CDP-6-deoxy-D-xylo-4-hexulose-3-dehydrase|tara:strand:- start:112 stop:1410 length:1299 start_codon:yes stop_codon:yes gene_type:complete